MPKPSTPERLSLRQTALKELEKSRNQPGDWRNSSLLFETNNNPAQDTNQNLKDYLALRKFLEANGIPRECIPYTLSRAQLIEFVQETLRGTNLTVEQILEKERRENDNLADTKPLIELDTNQFEEDEAIR